MKLALKDHMSRKLITISHAASIAEASRLMKNYWIRHLPVLDANEEYIIGMVSERDIMNATSTEAPVEKIMSTPIKTFPIDTPIRNVVDAMVEEKISAFLITRDDEIVGIVTSEDMMMLLLDILNEDDTTTWSLGEIFSSPSLQRTAYLVGQTGL